MRIRIGEQEHDLATPGEVAGAIQELLRGMRGEGPRTVRPDESAVLDANGNGTIEIYKVPMGYEFSLHRLVLDMDGQTPVAPYTNANGYALIQRSGEMVDFISFAAGAGGVPAVYTAGGPQASRYRNGEYVELAIFSGPANRSVRAKVQGTLEPITLV